MAETSSIEWTDATWNPITGCSVVSPGCTHCYAMRLAGTRLAHHPSRQGLTRETKAGPVWTGEVRLNKAWLTQPLGWKRPRRIFVCAHGDLFAEGVPDEWIDRVFAVMASAPQHTFQVLTKRASRMRAYLDALVCADGYRQYVRRPGWQARSPRDRDRVLLLSEGQSWPLPNVWLGVSAEDQARADARIPDLLATPAAIRFVSDEPLLGPIELERWLHALDWVIVGGESGRDARPMHPDWVRSLRDQCLAAGTPFFFKQWGAWAPRIDRDRDDPDWRLDYARAFADDGPMRWLNRAGGRGFHGERFHVMERVGKADAGRLLDGVQYDAMPAGGVHA